MLQQQRFSAQAKCSCNVRPFFASPAPRTRSNLSRQMITCQAQPSSRPHTQQEDSAASAGPLSVIAAAAATAVLLWPAQAAQALPEAQLEQIRQAIDKDFQQGQVNAGPLAMSTHKGPAHHCACLNCCTSVYWEILSVAWGRNVFCCL